jgi:hypothetical protein
MPRPTFEHASQTRIPFGQHRGQTIDQVARTDKGLKYLDWLLGQDWLRQEMRNAIEAYVLHPSIAQELDRVLS